MAEPVRYTTLEADAGGLPSFSSPGNIFDVPNTLLGGFPIGADTGYGTLLGGSSPFAGVGVTFAPPATSVSFGPSGSMIGGNLSLGDMINPWNVRTDITQLAPNWGTWNPATANTTAADTSNVMLRNQPYNNIPISGSQGQVNPQGTVSTTGSTGDAVQLGTFKVNETTLPTGVVDASYFTTTPVTGGAGLLGGVTTGDAGGGAVMLDPYYVAGTKTQGPSTITLSTTPSGATGGDTGAGATLDDKGAVKLPPFVTSANRTTPDLGTLDWNKYQENILNTINAGNPIVLPTVTVTPNNIDTTDRSKVSITQTGTARPSDFVNTDLGPKISTGVNISQTGTADTTPIVGLPRTGTPPGAITQTGTATPSTTTSTSSAMTQRDIAAELAKTLPALQNNQAAIQKMYGDLYSQFMPKGISQTEQGLIDQYQRDLSRLQQRQAGVLAPEDIRQSQQAAREAYGARGQVMAPGAIGAEILNRENIRQQREDQARAALQQSYGNILNTANIQTGNLFSPIASLMSGTFNPLGAYPADVYGTNVNAQLAREIAQKNYEAAVKSAELSGAAAKQAATTSATGSIFGPALGAAATKGISAIFTVIGVPPLSCMPGDQCIDTPTGPKAVKDLKGGDQVIGYDGEVAYIAQACSWNQDPLRTFLTITREDGSSFTVCDDHKVMGIPAMEWVEGADLAGSKITSIKPSTGLLTSYDILTNQGGYRINGVPVNSMIPEIIMQVVEFHRQVDRNLQAASA